MVRSISRVALAFALATGMAATGAAVTPAVAKEKKKEAAGEYSKEFVEAYKPMADAVSAGSDLSTFKPQVPALLALVKSDDEKMAAGNVVFNIGNKTQDQAMQLQGVELMLESGKVPEANVASFSLAAGQLAYNAKDYAKAETYLAKAAAADPSNTDAKGLLASTYIADEKPAEGLALLDSTIKEMQAAGKPVPEGWAFNGMAAAVGQDDRPAAFKWGVMTLATDTRAQARSQAYRVVEAYSPYDGDVQLDLMRLMARDAGFTQPRQYLAYIELMQPMRRPGEAKTFFDGVGAQAPANNAMVAEAKSQANTRYAETLKGLDEDAPGASGDAALAIADTYLGYGKSAEAEAAYSKALSSGVTDQAKALTGLGIAQADQGKYAEAKATFEKITGPRSDLATLWIGYVDTKTAA